jgi:guanylate kinase
VSLDLPVSVVEIRRRARDRHQSRKDLIDRRLELASNCSCRGSYPSAPLLYAAI